MAQLRQDYDEFTRRNAEILVLGPDSREKFQRYWQEHSLPFPGLADPSLEVLRGFGQQFRLLKFGRMPALIVIDREGFIRYRHFGESMMDIPSSEEVLAVLDALNREYEDKPGSVD